MTILLTDITNEVAGNYSVVVPYEWITAVLDTPIALQNSPLVPSVVTVKSSTLQVSYVAGTDFEVDYQSGEITLLGTGSITGGQQVVVSYTYDPVTRSVTDALIDFSQRYTFEDVYKLDIISGQSVYDLPDNFVRLIEFDGCGANYHPVANDIWLTDYFIQDCPDCNGRFLIGKQIVFKEAPKSNDTICIRYAAGYVVNESDEVTGLTEIGKQAVVLKARAIALGLPSVTLNGQAQQNGLTSYSYKLGDTQVTKKWDASATPTKQRVQLLGEYESIIQQLIGFVSMRGQAQSLYPVTGDRPRRDVYLRRRQGRVW